jgi:TQXA domain-containing protein
VEGTREKKRRRGTSVHKKRVVSFLLMLVMLFGMLPSAVLAADEKYVSFQYGSGTKTEGTYIDGYNYTSSVSTLYVMTESAFKTYTGGDPLASGAEVAYCFNMSKAWPEKFPGKVYYNKTANADAATFYNTAANPKVKNKDTLYQQIMSIGLNGYPLDYSGFNRDENGNQILSDDSFRTLTQKAIWHFTDSDSWAERTYKASERENEIFNKLIGSVLTTTQIAEARAALDLYTWDSTSSPATSDKGYQNLLVIHQSSMTILDLTKEVVNADASSDSFTFTVNLTANDSKSYWINDLTTGTVTSNDKNGKVTVNLKAGQKLSISSLSSNFNYTIEESEHTDYETSVNVTGTGAVDVNNSRKVTGTNATDHTQVVYTNTKIPVDVGTGSLTVAKTFDTSTTTHVPTSVYADVEFDFTVALTGADGQPYNETVSYQTSAGTTGTWDAITDGTVTFKLKHGDYLYRRRRQDNDAGGFLSERQYKHHRLHCQGYHNDLHLYQLL